MADDYLSLVESAQITGYSLAYTVIVISGVGVSIESLPIPYHG